MVDMTDSTHIAMWFGSLKLLFCHLNPLYFTAHNQIRTGDPYLTKIVLFLLSYVGTNINYTIQYFYGGGGRIRTCVALWAAVLQTAPINHSG
ncbi:unnamed protein product, partial [marine sediment metagenome]